MKAQIILRSLFAWLCLLGLMFSFAWAQQAAPIVVHRLVGPEIDAQEFEKYRLSDVIDNLRRGDLEKIGVYSTQDSDVYILDLQLKNGLVKNREITSSKLKALSQKIEEQGADLLLSLTKLKKAMGPDIFPRVIIETEDENRLQGNCIQLSETALKVVTPLGTHTIRLEDIGDLILMYYISAGKYGMPTPDASRYLIFPSAIPLSQGKGYLQMGGFLGHVTGRVGLTDHISVMAGLKASGDNKVIRAMMNANVSTQLFPGGHIGGGVFLFDRSDGGVFDFFGYPFALELLVDEWRCIPYLELTLGKRDNNFSLGVGSNLPIQKEELKEAGVLSRNLVIMPSFILRSSKKTAIISENWFYRHEGDPQVMLALGIRRIERRFTADLFLATSTDHFEYAEVPFLWPCFDIVWHF
jgi:hypothetical protein